MALKRTRSTQLSLITNSRIKLQITTTTTITSTSTWWKSAPDDPFVVICAHCNQTITRLPEDHKEATERIRSYLLLEVYQRVHVYTFCCDDCRDQCLARLDDGGVCCIGCFRPATSEAALVRVPIRYASPSHPHQAIKVTFCEQCYAQRHIRRQLESIRYTREPVLIPRGAAAADAATP